PLPGTDAKIFVAVADVDALVPKGGALDQYDARNTTSVYTAGGVFPMPPENLSNDLTSLNDSEDRMALVIEMTVRAEGVVAASGATAAFLERRGVPSLRRVLRSPERWARIVDVAREHGGALPDAPDARALEQFLAQRRAADPERFPDLSLSIVKLTGRGEYVVDV